jgi:hypothetical protein
MAAKAPLSAGLHIENFEGVVPERGDVESLRGYVGRQVIDPAFHSRKLDRLDQYQWRLA